MRTILLLLFLSMVLLPAAAGAEATLEILFTANSYGQYDPCPS